MNFSLPNGKVIDMPLNIFLDLDDEAFNEEIQDLMSRDLGISTEDYWFNSALSDTDLHKKENQEDEDDSTPDLTRIDEIDTIEEMDFSEMD